MSTDKGKASDPTTDKTLSANGRAGDRNGERRAKDVEHPTPALRSDTLPLPEPPFHGKIGMTYADSEADIIAMPMPPAGAPNVLLVLLDDVGFGQASTFGGPANTPTLQKLADEGLRYNRFHTTALCSPSRAALLSGRNHHSVHTGTIMEMATGFPGYDSLWPKEAACIAEALRGNGYSTAAFGKWHNTPDFELGAAGPFDRWPTGHGFDYWWGFQGGEADQWHTPLFENTAPVEPPSDDPTWHFSEAMASQAIAWIGKQKGAAPDKPFFIYFAPGACHTPHHVPKEYIANYKGKFDHGWDRQRELTLDQQKKLGVVPNDTKLTPRPDSIPSWDSRSADEKRLYARMQEVFAGFLEHVDAQIGRVVTAIETMGLRDDTLIIYIVGDNGPSAEGSLTGTLNNVKSQAGLADDVPTMLQHIDEIGGPGFENHYPVGWSWASSSPFQWMKQVASHWGGTRNGLIVHWPNGIKAKGEIRNQWRHVIDVAPTVLAAASLPFPTMVNGVLQEPLHGVDMAYSFDDPDAAERHETQYFEMVGNRGIYHKGWTAVTRHRIPWVVTGTPGPFAEDVWELYDTTTDWSQAHNLAAEMPEKLAALQQLFLLEASKYNVFPLDDRAVERANPDIAGRPAGVHGNTQILFGGTTRLSENVVLNVKNKSHVVTAEIEAPESGAAGVIVAQGGNTGGWSLYAHEGRLKYCYNLVGVQSFYVTADAPLPAGVHQARMEFAYDGGGIGKGGAVTLYVDGEKAGEGRVDRTHSFHFSLDETLDVGCDLGSPVAADYGPTGNAFTGRVNWVQIDIGEDSHDHMIDHEQFLQSLLAIH